jgi:hypothetical protein
MSVCGVLSDYTYNCNFPEAGGAADEILIIPHSRIDREAGDEGFTRNETNPHIIEKIHLKVGAKASVFTGKRNPNAVMSEYTIQDFSSGYAHGAMFNIYEISPATANSLKALDQEKVLVVLRTNQSNSTGNNRYKVAGANVGLYLSEANYSSSENQGVIPVTLAPEGDQLEPRPIEFLFDTDIATTSALYEALKVVVPTPET